MDALETKGGSTYSIRVERVNPCRAVGSGRDYRAARRLMMRKLMKDSRPASLDLHGCSRKVIYQFGEKTETTNTQHRKLLCVRLEEACCSQSYSEHNQTHT